MGAPVFGAFGYQGCDDWEECSRGVSISFLQSPEFGLKRERYIFLKGMFLINL